MPPNDSPTPPLPVKAAAPAGKVLVTNTQAHVVPIYSAKVGVDPVFLVPGVPIEIDAHLIDEKTGHPAILAQLSDGRIVKGRAAKKAAVGEAVDAMRGRKAGERGQMTAPQGGGQQPAAQ